MKHLETCSHRPCNCGADENIYGKHPTQPTQNQAEGHSLTPWSVELNSCLVHDAHGLQIADTFHNSPKDVPNAAHIAACVNFCAGLTNEQLGKETLEQKQIRTGNLVNKLSQDLAALRTRCERTLTYAEHKAGCEHGERHNFNCTCGLDAPRAEVKVS